MNQQPIEKEFDCLAYKREVQLKIYERIKDLSIAEEVAYFQQAVDSGPFAEWWKSLPQAAPTISAS
jgi:hypothetical protein